MPNDAVVGGRINFTNWMDAAELPIKFVETLGKYTIDVAATELVEAQD